VKIRLQNNNTTILAMNQEVKEYFRNAVEVRNFVFRDVIFEHPQSVISKFSLLDYSHFYFGCGRLIPLKNWSLAIKALKFTHDQYPLIIAGEGKDLSLLKRLAKRHGVRDRVVFLGALSRGETLTLTKKAKCFVFPSVRDSFSSALAEAVHLGTPIACLGTSGNLAVLRVGGPSMEPKKNLTAEEFACLMENPIQFSKLESFRYDDFVSEMDQAINVSE
jgi:glycosyltransferase involved in cell wall biosynthesis